MFALNFNRCPNREHNLVTCGHISYSTTVLLIHYHLDLVALTSNKAKQKTLAQRLITLSDEVRTNKIAFLQQRRAVQVYLVLALCSQYSLKLWE